MVKKQRSKTLWLGLVIIVYSFFLFCQGVWSSIYYNFIYPGVLVVIPGYDYRWSIEMSYFTEALVIVTPIIGGLILMGIGRWVITNREKSRKLTWVSLIIVSYSFVLLFQTLWDLFGYPGFYSEWHLYAIHNVGYPRFPILLGVVIPPLLGSILFLAIGSYLLKVGVRERHLLMPKK